MIEVHNSHVDSLNDMPGTFLGPGEMVVNKKDKRLFPHRADILVGILRIMKEQSFVVIKYYIEKVTLLSGSYLETQKRFIGTELTIKNLYNIIYISE